MVIALASSQMYPNTFSENPVPQATISYSELSNKRTAGNNRTADPEVMKLIIGPQVLIGPQD